MTVAEEAFVSRIGRGGVNGGRVVKCAWAVQHGDGVSGGERTSFT